MITIDGLITLRNSESFRGFEGVDGPTPISFCDSQINKIPCDYSEPNAKWLFPAAGHGTYAIIVYWRYMDSLSNIFTDEEERSRHILENMLYLNEKEPWFCRQLRKQGFLNIIEGDYLKYGKNMKFDVVIGNPPYNDEGGIQKGGKNLYSKFIDKSIDLLNQDGYLSFVTNAGYLKTTTEKRTPLLDKILTKNLIYLNINECKKWFPNVGGAMVFSYFLLQNNSNYELTECCTQLEPNSQIFLEKVDLSKMNWVPRIITKEVLSIVEKCQNESYDFVRVDSVETRNLNLTNKIGFKRLNHLVKPYSVSATNNIDKGTFILTETNNIEEDLKFFNSKIFRFLNVIHRYDAIIYHKLLKVFGKPKSELSLSEINFIDKVL